MKKYTIKPTKKQKAIIDLFWNMFLQEENIFFQKVRNLEKKMERRTGIKGIEFLIGYDGSYYGIGNFGATMKAIVKR